MSLTSPSQSRRARGPPSHLMSSAAACSSPRGSRSSPSTSPTSRSLFRRCHGQRLRLTRSVAAVPRATTPPWSRWTLRPQPRRSRSTSGPASPQDGRASRGAPRGAVSLRCRSWPQPSIRSRPRGFSTTSTAPMKARHSPPPGSSSTRALRWSAIRRCRSMTSIITVAGSGLATPSVHSWKPTPRWRRCHPLVSRFRWDGPMAALAATSPSVNRTQSASGA